MNQIAFVFGDIVIHSYSLIFALSLCVGVFLMMYCCEVSGICRRQACTSLALTLLLGALIGRFLYWNYRGEQYASFVQAFLDTSTLNFALPGLFAACGLTALITRKKCELPTLLDCMSVALCAGLCLGRLALFASAADRGAVAEELTGLPFAYPVINLATGEPEYRIATFLYQSIAAGMILVLVTFIFKKTHKQEYPAGSAVRTFLLSYCASQVLLDSTRYDSLFFRLNGFVSMVQVLSALTLAVVLVMVSRTAVKKTGMMRIYYWAWGGMVGLFGLAGFMEYYVQRHGRQALFYYVVMEHCLIAIVLLGLWLMKQGRKAD